MRVVWSVHRYYAPTGKIKRFGGCKKPAEVDNKSESNGAKAELLNRPALPVWLLETADSLVTQ